jgi:hypothetical protein
MPIYSILAPIAVSMGSLASANSTEILVAISDDLSVTIVDRQKPPKSSFVDELRELNEAVALALRATVNRSSTASLHVSPFGNSVALTGLASDAPEPYVAIWPNWQEPEERVELPGWRRLKYASPNHVMIFSSDKSIIVDLSTRLQFTLPRDSSHVSVASGGRWASTSKDSQAIGGQLDTHDALQHPTIRFGADIESILLLHGGSIVVTQSTHGLIETRHFGQDAPLDSAEGRMSTPSSETGFAGVSGSRSVYFSVDDGGQIDVHQLEWLGGPFDERLKAISPLQWSAITNADTLLPGGYERKYRVVPWAPKGATSVELPRGQEVAWLLWRAESE